MEKLHLMYQIRMIRVTYNSTCEEEKSYTIKLRLLTVSSYATSQKDVELTGQ